MAVPRILTADDAPAYRTVRLNALRSDPDAFGSSHDAEAAFTADEWRARVTPQGGVCFGIDGPDGLVATGTVIVDWEGTAAMVLVAMWTEPDHRGVGHGRAIVESAIAFARASGAARIRCSVTEGNVGAERLYAACGLARTGVVDTRESDGLRHVHMDLRF